MKRKKPLVLFCGLLFGAHSFAFAASQMPFQYDKNTLAQVEALYGIDENAAITRLAKEYDAAVQARYIEGRNLPGYAGAWFDSDTQGLVVATNQPEDFRVIERAGATPALVSYSLAELNAARTKILDALQSNIGPVMAPESSVDVQTNSVSVGVVDNAMSRASEIVATLGLNAPVRLVSAVANDSGFSSNLLGADRTRNSSWPLVGGQYSPCSVGASAEKVAGTTYPAGFATAGHCGEALNSFVADDGTTSVGQVMQSTFIYSSYTEPLHEDGAWVQTVSAWVPQSQVDGYSDGTINVSGTWAGTLAAPVGTTACRYGSTSGGPHCASVTARNASVYVGGYLFNGMIEVDGICTDDGDSGGPLITPANQVQGTVTGGTPNSCPDSSGDYVYFQPITTTVSRAASSLGNPVAMLT